MMRVRTSFKCRNYNDISESTINIATTSDINQYEIIRTNLYNFYSYICPSIGRPIYTSEITVCEVCTSLQVYGPSASSLSTLSPLSQLSSTVRRCVTRARADAPLVIYLVISLQTETRPFIAKFGRKEKRTLGFWCCLAL